MVKSKQGATPGPPPSAVGYARVVRAMAGPVAPPMPQRPQRGQPKGGLAGPELQLVEERLLELQFGLLSLHDDDDEVRMRACSFRTPPNSD